MVNLNAGGTFNQSGGSLIYNTFNQQGGTVTGALENRGLFNYYSGDFQGRLLNYGTANLGSSFTAGNGLMQAAGAITLNVGSGQSLTLNGAGLNNQGTFTMAGGTLTGGGLLTNNASFSGYGTINASAGFNNYGNMTLTGGTSSVSGAFDNESTGSLYIYNQSTFGNVTNDGYIKVYGGAGNFTYLTFTDNGTYYSDPATNNMQTLNIGANGALQGGVGDKWVISGNFSNCSLNNITWNTVGAALSFTGGGSHTLDLPGADLGRTRAGYTNNFAWGSLDLTGQTLTLRDGNTTPGGALYVGTILGVLLSGGQVTDIYGNGLDIYYDSSLAGNAYLAGLTYALADGGYLAPVTSDFLSLGSVSPQNGSAPTPLPGTVWLLLSGLAGLGLWRRKSGRGPGPN